MENTILHLFYLGLLSTLLFSVSCACLLRSALRTVTWSEKLHSSHSTAALKVSKYYQMFAWGLLSLVFLGTLVMTFFEIFATV